MKQMVRAIPDVLVWANAEVGPKPIWESLPDETVDSVRGDEQVPLPFQQIKSCNFSSKLDFDAKFFAALLQDLQQAQARNPGKAVAMNGSLLGAMNYIDIVPGCKVPRDFGVRRFIRSAQIRERLPGKHHAPAKRIVGAIAFGDCDLVRGISLLHEDREVHAGGAATDDVDFHSRIS